MSYSKPMRVNYKRLFTFWFITLLIAGLIGSGITMLLMKPKDVEALETCETEVYFFTHEVQEPEPIDIIEPILEEPILESLGEYRITAYCPCEICCGIWAKNRPGGIVVGAYGVELEEDVSIAAPLPSNTRLYIDGIGEYTVQDKLADWVLEKYDNKVVDIYFNSHEDAKAFGLQHKEVFIVKGDMEND